MFIKRIIVYIVFAGCLIFVPIFSSKPVQAKTIAYYPYQWGFIPNRGQFDPSVHYLFFNDTYQVRINQDAIWIVEQVPNKGSIEFSTITLCFPGSNPQVQLLPFNQLDGQLSFLTGTSSDNWRVGLPMFSGMRYVDLYPNIDLVLSTTQKGNQVFSLDWHLETRPGADLNQVKLQVEGAKLIQWVESGLLLKTNLGEWILPLLPVVGSMNQPPKSLTLQHTGSQTFILSSPFVNSGSDNNFNLFQQETPGLIYSTYLGGSNWETAYGIAIDSDGSAYVVGRTPSKNFPVTPGAYDSTASQVDIFVAKFNRTGDRLEYATFIGGSGTDSGYAIAVKDGIVYITGETDSSDFPQSSSSLGETDAFLLALNPDGSSLKYVTRLGGSTTDSGYAVALEGTIAYITGATNSYDFPASGYLAEEDVFLVKVDSSGKIISAWLFGGVNTDIGTAIVVKNGDSYLAGETYSPDFPGTGFSGNGDSFFLKVNATGGIEQSRIFGGSAIDRGSVIGVTLDGEVYLAGTTSSVNFPATQGSYKGGLDGFLLHLGTDGNLLGGKFIGGQGDDEVTALSLDNQGRLYLAGYTNSNDFPTSPDSLQAILQGRWDGFLVRLDPSNQVSLGDIHYASFFGGSEDDFIRSMAIDLAGNPFITGNTASMDLPLSPQALDSNLDGLQDAFISGLELNTLPPNLPAFTVTPTYPVVLSHTPTATTVALQNQTGTPSSQPIATEEVILTPKNTQNQIATLTPTVSAVQIERTQSSTPGTSTPLGSSRTAVINVDKVKTDQITSLSTSTLEAPTHIINTSQITPSTIQPNKKTVTSLVIPGVGVLIILLTVAVITARHRLHRK